MLILLNIGRIVFHIRLNKLFTDFLIFGAKREPKKSIACTKKNALTKRSTDFTQRYELYFSDISVQKMWIKYSKAVTRLEPNIDFETSIQLIIFFSSNFRFVFLLESILSIGLMESQTKLKSNYENVLTFMLRQRNFNLFFAFKYIFRSVLRNCFLIPKPWEDGIHHKGSETWARESLSARVGAKS